MGLKNLVEVIEMVKDLKKMIDSQPDLVHCPYKRCKDYGTSLECYMDLYHNCEKYNKWKYALQLIHEHNLRKRKEKERLRQHFSRPDNLKF